MSGNNRNTISRELIWEYALLILIFVLGYILFRQAQKISRTTLHM